MFCDYTVSRFPCILRLDLCCSTYLPHTYSVIKGDPQQPRMRHMALLSLLGVVHATWDTLVSPSTKKAYLKLSTNDLIEVDFLDKFTSGQSVTTSSLIDAPTKGNYSLALANGQLYAFFQDSDDEMMNILELNDNNEWDTLTFDTTLSQNTTQFYTDSTLMTSYDSKSGKELIYIYGGRQSNSITNRLLELNPTKKTLQSVMTSVAPTSFYGASNAILDINAKANILIGGKASSGWVSMFQIALWEYGSWTFKTVKSAEFSVNSRINPLVIPVFSNDSANADSMVVIGGELGNNWASPYVLRLNMTDEWKWQNITGKGDFKPKTCIGAVVVDDTLISISKGSASNKRDGTGYQLNLYDVKNFDTTKSFSLSISSSVPTTSSASSSSKESSTSSQKSSQTSANSISSHTTSVVAATTSAVASASTTAVSHNSGSSKSTIAIATVVPIVAIALIAIIAFFLWKRYIRGSHYVNDSDSSSSTTAYSDEYFKAMVSDQASITSWNYKRDEYTRKLTTTPTLQKRQSVDAFTFEGTTPVSTPQQVHHLHQTASALPFMKGLYSRPSPARTRTRASGPFANPEDYEDMQDQMYSQYNNQSKASLRSGSGVADDEENKIDEFLGERDVQVLVSSKRRSKLRITNPDLADLDEDVESLKHDNEVMSTDTGSTIYDHEGEMLGQKLDQLDFGDERGYIEEILKAFGDEEMLDSSNDKTNDFQL
ncbi:CYFA0S39e00276g1_1 [Cyberlindnera fabianii]|uniref:CYFA0S39e00276g1_1 n=1 Tax=Cyberlindnera fabianii TaxID=36022 RepID=A0A061BLG6_CYBFA|nr:CYFA0S39e00276g1_1 [Cyberlindnera fabianii]